jgi:thiamine biosynthesis lipoprotein
MSTLANNNLSEFMHEERLMGNRFQITVVADNEAWAKSKIQLAITEIRRIETLLTTFDESSETSLINKYAGLKAVQVNKEVFNLIKRSIKISMVTDGAFDITYGSLDKSLWNFDTSMTALPDKNTARSMVKLINFRNIVLNEKKSTVMLKEKGMRIGFGGMGKGYAAEKAKTLLKKEGVVSGIVNASGDLTTWGCQANNKPWTIGISNPENTKYAYSYMNISDMAVATSGSYEKFVLINGIKYSHTINPRTGFPVRGIKSVTIISPNAEISDAIATPVTVMGVEAGLNLINQLPQLGCILIDDNNKIHTSKNIKLR